MKPLSIILCSVFFIFSLMENRVFPAAAGMGMISTVHTEGAADVSRNPAVISTHKKSSAGIFLNYRAFYDQKVTSFDIAGMESEDLETELKTKYQGGLSAAFILKNNKNAWGMAVSQGKDDQISYVKKNENISFSSLHEEKSINEKKFNPAIILSYSALINDNYSYGIRVRETYMYYSSNTESQTFSSAVKIEENHTDEKYSQFATDLAFGILRKKAGTEAGITISAGPLVFEKRSIDYSFQDFITPVQWDGSESTGYIRRTKGGLSIEAGGYKKITPFFAAAVETGYAVPFSTGDNTFEKDKAAMTYKKRTLYGTTNGTYAFRAGMEWTFLPCLALSAGGAYYSLSSENTGSTSKSKLKVNVWIATLSLDYHINENYRLTIGSFFNYSDNNVEYTTGSISFTSSSRSIQTDIIAGADIKF